MADRAEPGPRVGRGVRRNHDSAAIVAPDGLTSICRNMTEFMTPSAEVAIPLIGRVPHRVP